MLEVDALSVSAKGKRILGGVSFSMKRGECLGIVGTMGSGKTTLLYAIKGIIPGLKPGKVGGAIRFMGGERLPMDKRIGIVFQNPNDQVFCSTLAEEVGFGLKNLGIRGNDIRFDKEIDEINSYYTQYQLSLQPKIKLRGRA